MADISNEIQAINSAVYGSQVRSSIIDALTKINSNVERIEMAKNASVYIYKGSVSTMAELPNSRVAVGDCYYVASAEVTYAWNGSAWNSIGAIAIDGTPSVNTGAEETTAPPTEEENSGSATPD